VLAKGLEIPWGLAFLPNGDALLGERTSGRLHRVSRRGGRRQVGIIRSAVDHGEGGLLGIAVSPTFHRDRWVYLYLTTETDNRIIRKRYVDGAVGRTQVLLKGIPRGRLHNGGRLAFSPGGRLFASTGDTGDSSLAQDPASLAGKILRIEADGSIPSTNPIEDSPVWTRGHRNVQGLAWDRYGVMWATELGQSERDELNRIRKGRNYGWPDVEGGDGSGPYADPFVTWSPTSTCSPSGVAVARGRAWVAALAGHCLYSVWLRGENAGRVRKHFAGTLGRIRTVQAAPDGTLWLTTSNSSGSDSRPGVDRVVRIHL
jgi:glucose/arabinose dehydrogenase